MKKVAIPIANNKISEYLCECSHFLFYDTESKSTEFSKNNTLNFGNADEVRLWLKDNEITDIILHRIRKELIGIFTSEKINLFIGVPEDSAEQIIQTYRCGKLESDKNIIKEITN